MPRQVRIRAEYKEPFNKEKYLVALLALARLRLASEVANSQKNDAEVPTSTEGHCHD